MDFLILFWKCLCTKFFFSDDNDSSRNISASSHRVVFLHHDCMRMQNVVLFCLIGQLQHDQNIHLISLFFRRQSIGLPTLLYVYFKLFCPSSAITDVREYPRRSSPTRQTYAMRETRDAEDADETPKNC